MKKIIPISMAIFLSITLAACGNETSPPTNTAANDATPPENSEASPPESPAAGNDNGESAGIEVDESMTEVTITLPASLFQGETGFDPNEYVKEQGFNEAVVNEDGSVSVTMNKSKHNELMSEMKKTVDEALDGFVEGEQTPYIKAISAEEDYKSVTVDVAKSDYENAFDITPFAIGIQAVLYQQLAGTEPHCTVIIRDVDTGETINSVIYPDDLET